jgi:hypothetical protein
MRFEVPQFIEIEDKIFGPFTWRQFVYLLGGVGIATVLFITTHIIIFVLIGLPIAGLALLLAFYPVNNRPFAVFLESVVQYLNSSRLYLWRKQGTGIYGAAEKTTDVTSAVVNHNAFTPTVGTQNLTSLSRRLELNALERK